MKSTVNSLSIVAMILVASILSGACSSETTDSTNIATRAVWAGITVDADKPDDTRVNVELNVGGRTGTNIELAGSERLEASVGGLTKVLVKDTDLFDVDYEAHFPTSSSAEPFRIRFFRDDGSINGNSVVTLPDEFTIQSPNSGQSFSSDSFMQLSWAPGRAGLTIDYILTTGCKNSTGGTVFSSSTVSAVDDGSENYSFSLLNALNNPDLDRTQPCQFSLRLVRRQTGTIDPAFEAGGEINATQSRAVENMFIVFPQN